MASLKSRLSEIRQLGREPAPELNQRMVRRLLVVVGVMVLLTLLPWINRAVTAAKGGRGRGAEGGALQHQDAAAASLESREVPESYRVFYSPENDLAAIDAQVMGRAKRSLDVVVGERMDERLCEVLEASARQHVTVRVYEQDAVDGKRSCEDALIGAGVELRRAAADVPVREQSYLVDGVLLRSGSADLWAEATSRTEADLVLVQSKSAGVAFDRHFDGLWQRARASKAPP